MHRILIVDDRPERPMSHLPEEEVIGIKALDGLDFMSEAPEAALLEKYDLIAIHRTYVLEKDLRGILLDLIKKNGKYVILFSGGINQLTVAERCHMMTIPSGAFYSTNLLPFCKEIISTEEKIQPYKLVYGSKGWKLPLCLRLRHILWQDPDLEDMKKEKEVDELRAAIGMDDQSIEEYIRREALSL